MNEAEKKKGKRPFTKIQWKIFWYLSLFAALILILFWFFQVVFLDRFYKIIKTNEIKEAGTRLERVIGSDDADFRDTANAITERNDVCLRVFRMADENNAVEILSLDTLPECMAHNMSRRGVFQLYDAAVGNGGSLIRHFRYSDAMKSFYRVDDNSELPADAAASDVESIVYVQITTDPQGRTFLILLNSIITPVTATVKTVKRLMLYLSVIVALAALLFAWMMARWIGKPIAALNEASRHLADGSFPLSSSTGSYKEIAELSDTLVTASEKMTQTETMQRELIANISHDLRTPLTLICGYGEMMRDIPGENTAENMQVILDETGRLSSLVSDLLDISKLQAGRQELQPAMLSLRDVLTQAVDRYGRLAAPLSCRVLFESETEEEVYLYTDETRLLQALTNLLNNAIAHVGEDRTVWVVLRTVEEGGRKQARILVVDHGSGIAPEELPMIWNRYYKAEKDHKRAPIGSGLGLSIVRQVMELLGGSCGVASTPGEGSTFWLQLPLSDEEAMHGPDAEI